MKKLVSGALSSLVILSATLPARAEIPTFTVAQSQSTIEQMFRQQRVLTEEIQTMMAEMKTMMAEMKALTALPVGQSATMNDLYKQQQILAMKVDSLIGRTRFDTIQPRTTETVTVQEVHQQQTAMMAEMKEMMAEMKKMIAVYRGRGTEPRQ